MTRSSCIMEITFYQTDVMRKIRPANINCNMLLYVPTIFIMQQSNKSSLFLRNGYVISMLL